MCETCLSSMCLIDAAALRRPLTRGRARRAAPDTCRRTYQRRHAALSCDTASAQQRRPDSGGEAMTQTQPPIVLTGVSDLTIDEAALRKHVLLPQHVTGIISSQGLNDEPPLATPAFQAAKAYNFDVDGFGKGLHAALKDSVVGYVMRLRHNGNTIYTLQWNWAKRPDDVGEGWNPDVRMHIASVSKLITGIAMTRLLNKKGISPDTAIKDYLPKYWK